VRERAAVRQDLSIGQLLHDEFQRFGPREPDDGQLTDTHVTVGSFCASRRVLRERNASSAGTGGALVDSVLAPP